jgi:4-hydroxy-tetrahydrodipicolinate synthase
MTSTSSSVEWCIDEAKGRVPVIAGAGSNSTGGDRTCPACRKGRRRRGAGGDALLQQADPGRAVPALQGDQRRHRNSDHHLQHSRRSVIDMSVETMKRLFECKNIAGVKDATANMVRVSQQREASDRISTSSRARTARVWGSWRMAAMAAFQ